MKDYTQDSQTVRLRSTLTFERWLKIYRRVYSDVSSVGAPAKHNGLSGLEVLNQNSVRILSHINSNDESMKYWLQRAYRDLPIYIIVLNIRVKPAALKIHV